MSDTNNTLKKKENQYHHLTALYNYYTFAENVPQPIKI